MITSPATIQAEAAAGTIRRWLDALLILAPPSSAIVAGAGTYAWVQFLRGANVRNTILFEADPALFPGLRRSVSDQPGWAIRQELISSAAGRSHFHRTTVPSENGPVEPAVLHALWPNLEITETLELETTPLSDVLADLPSSGAWLFLDQLPAGPIIDAVGTPLDKVSLIVARATTPAVPGLTSHEHLVTSLASRGFDCLMFEPGRNPAAGHGLFVRRFPSLAWDLDSLRRSAAPLAETARTIRSKRPTVHPAASFYLHLGERENPPPFVLLDSKSLPRSGIHYLKSRLAKLLGTRFSFCEWYHEPGCCASYPCALDCFVGHAERTGDLRIRLIKSHDFELTDPVLGTGPHLKRLILARDPIYMLTSWFELEQFEIHKEGLREAGILVDKIWFHHEKEVVNAATAFVDHRFHDPGSAALDAWLADKVSFMGGFVRKWINPEMRAPTAHVHLLRYDRIDSFLRDFLGSYRTFLPSEALAFVDSSESAANDAFRARTDPFHVKSGRISACLRNNRDSFEAAAKAILACDEHGFFS